MTEDETRRMEAYGITSEAKTVFYFGTHKYERLQDALNYAEKLAQRSGKLPEKSASE